MAQEQKIIQDLDAAFAGLTVTLQTLQKITAANMQTQKEQMAYIEEKISKVLSGLELEVLTSYLDGKSYQEIASDLERHSKSIDNALQRVKRKLEKCLDLK